MTDVRAAERAMNPTREELHAAARRILSFADLNQRARFFDLLTLGEVIGLAQAYLATRPDATGPDLGRLAEWLRTTAGHCRQTGSWLTPPLTADNGSEWADKLTQAADALARRGRDAGEVERLREERDKLRTAGGRLAECNRDDALKLVGLADEVDALKAERDQLRERVRLLEEACKAGVQFIENGVECGYIRMPDTPDPAHKTLPMLRAALAPTPPTGRHR